MKKMFHNLISWKLKIFAKWLLKNHRPLVIGITGSVAKTSTKEAIYQVLSKSKRFEGKVKKSEGNLNTEIGLPLAILGFDKSPGWWQWPIVLLLSFFRVLIPQLNPLTHISILILEYAADKPGDIKYLTSFIKPDIGIITIIGPAHLVNYVSIEEIASEKAELVKNLVKDGIAILNKNDIYTEKIAKNLPYEIKYFQADLGNITNEIIKLIGKIFVIDQNVVEKAIQDIKPLNHRLNIIQKNNWIIIDDSYNANPLSMQLALEFLSKKAIELKSARKIAVLGDMLELGNNSDQYHQQIGQLARKYANILIGIGALSKFMKPDQWFENYQQAESYLLNNLQENDIILFKASRRMELDKLVERILAR